MKSMVVVLAVAVCLISFAAISLISAKTFASCEPPSRPDHQPPKTIAAANSA
jgi:hypothetical protein